MVAKGFTQTYSIDYQETFAPVAKDGTIRALIFLCRKSEMGSSTMDVTNAFLHGELEEKST